MLIGILSLQGDYSLHANILNQMNVDYIFVNDIDKLNLTDGLIIPGGESTVISKLLIKTGLDNAIKLYSKNKNIFGTCAGAVLMSKICIDDKVDQLNVIGIESFRNSWGSQIYSFHDYVNLNFSDSNCSASFIRAPKIKVVDDNITVLATYENEPVLVRNDNHLACTFHPEVNNDSIVHKYFLDMVNEKI